jgi:organic hydroperoxide reductase OsmC/OhrA
VSNVRSKQFTYKTEISWLEERKLLLSSSGKPSLTVATPPEFHGHEGCWSPEDLFVASVNACILTTFLFHAHRKKLDLKTYESAAEGTLENVDGVFMFSTIAVHPKVVVASEDDVEKARELLERAEKGCLISNSAKSKITLHPDVTVQPDVT